MSTDGEDTSRLRIIAPVVALIPAVIRRRMTIGSAWAMAIAILVAAGGAYRSSVNTSKDIQDLRESVGKIELATQGLAALSIQEAVLAANQSRDEQDLRQLADWRMSLHDESEKPNPYVTRKRK